jgi:hypothetical protein
MTMAPPRDPQICPVCGEPRDSGCHACPGPKIVFKGCDGGCACHGASGSAVCGTCCSGAAPGGAL